MLLCPIHRGDLLQLLPKGGEVVEIGVAKGEFSREIVSKTQPRKLHLIDPWEHQQREDYRHDGNNVAADEHDERYRDVVEDFAEEVEKGQVEIHRAYSSDAVTSFADGQLDWIYIDGLHSYDGVISDLTLYKDKVKPDGLIVGHDYTNHVKARGMGFGVVEAVNDFVRRENYAFIALAIQEAFPTYVLARTQDTRSAAQLRAQLFFHLPFLVDLREFPTAGAFEHTIIEVGGRVKAVPSF